MSGAAGALACRSTFWPSICFRSSSNFFFGSFHKLCALTRKHAVVKYKTLSLDSQTFSTSKVQNVPMAYVVLFYLVSSLLQSFQTFMLLFFLLSLYTGDYWRLFSKSTSLAYRHCSGKYFRTSLSSRIQFICDGIGQPFHFSPYAAHPPHRLSSSSQRAAFSFQVWNISKTATDEDLIIRIFK